MVAFVNRMSRARRQVILFNSRGRRRYRVNSMGRRCSLVEAGEHGTIRGVVWRFSSLLSLSWAIFSVNDELWGSHRTILGWSARRYRSNDILACRFLNDPCYLEIPHTAYAIRINPFHRQPAKKQSAGRRLPNTKPGCPLPPHTRRTRTVDASRRYPGTRPVPPPDAQHPWDAGRGCPRPAPPDCATRRAVARTPGPSDP